MDGPLVSPVSFLGPWNGINPQELHCKLLSAARELQKVKAEEKLQETKLWRLQELLSITMKERDQAREECRKLQECLVLQQNPPLADSPSSFVHSSSIVSSIVSSPSSSPWSLQELEEHLNNDDFSPSEAAMVSLELQNTLKSFSQSCGESQDLQALFCDGLNASGSKHDESDEQFNLQILQQSMSANEEAGLDLSQLETGSNLPVKASPAGRCLSRQSSSNSSSASVHHVGIHHGLVSLGPVGESMQPLRESMEPLGEAIVAETYIPGMVSVAENTPLPMPPLSGIDSVTYECSSLGPVGNNISGTTTLAMGLLPVSVSMGTSAISSAPTKAMPKRMKATSPPTAQSVSSLPLSQQQNPTNMRQVHLPEPPEADPRVMLSSLPEKGKLLQAVIQAGPLLQTLLLAGPLPQWRCPPPALSSGDIPKVSLVSGNVDLPPYQSYTQTQGMQCYYSTTCQTSASASTKRKLAGLDPCAQTKKLRKISPSPVKQSRLTNVI